MIQPMATTKKATAADLLATYGEDSRVEIIHGEMLEKAMGRVAHSGPQGALAAALIRRFRRKSGVASGPGGCPRLMSWWPAAGVMSWASEVLVDDLVERLAVTDHTDLHLTDVADAWS